MRMRPASLTAAAPPSSCQVTDSVRPIETSTSSSSEPPTTPSLVDSFQGLEDIAAVYGVRRRRGRSGLAARRAARQAGPGTPRRWAISLPIARSAAASRRGRTPG